MTKLEKVAKVIRELKEVCVINIEKGDKIYYKQVVKGNFAYISIYLKKPDYVNIGTIQAAFEFEFGIGKAKYDVGDNNSCIHIQI